MSDTPADTAARRRREHVAKTADLFLPDWLTEKLREAVTLAYDKGVEEGERRERERLDRR